MNFSPNITGFRFAYYLAAICFVVQANAENIAQVRTLNGKFLSAKVDSRSNDQVLKLYMSEPNILLGVSIPWSQVAEVQFAGDVYTSSAFHLIVRTIATRPDNPIADTNDPAAAQSLSGKGFRIDSEIKRASRESKPMDNPAPQWIEINAAIKNWDTDAAIDGIELQIVPRHSLGNSVAALGQVSAKLAARNFRPLASADAFPDLGQWSVAVAAKDYVNGVAIVRLPFSTSLRLQELDLQPIGSLEVRFHATGVGSFAARTPVLLEVFDPVAFDSSHRDNQILHRGLSHLHP